MASGVERTDAFAGQRRAQALDTCLTITSNPKSRAVLSSEEVTAKLPAASLLIRVMSDRVAASLDPQALAPWVHQELANAAIPELERQSQSTGQSGGTS
jgi:hypothetical protein